MPSMTVVCKYLKYIKSVLQSGEITLKDNKNFSFSYFMHICSCRSKPETLLFDHIYRVSQEECARLREGVSYVKVHRYNPKHLCPKLNGYRDNGQRKVWSSGGSTHCTCQLTYLSMSVLECGVILWQFSCKAGTVF